MEEHYVSGHLVTAKMAGAKFHKPTQNANGWMAILTCALSGKAYTVEVKEIKSAIVVEKPLMYKQVLSEFNRQIDKECDDGIN